MSPYGIVLGTFRLYKHLLHHQSVNFIRNMLTEKPLGLGVIYDIIILFAILCKI